jgi:hypothetical protein
MMDRCPAPIGPTTPYRVAISGLVPRRRYVLEKMVLHDGL